MAKAKAKEAATETQEAPKGQGRAIVLPNGEKRIDFIRDRYYKDGKSRSEIKNEINEMLENAGQADQQIPYQIVFSATKEGEQGNAESDPRNKPKESKAKGDES